MLLAASAAGAAVARPGDPAPDFSLKDIGGRTISLEACRGKVVLLDFWATWCGPCREELREIEHFHRTYGDSGLVVIAVSTDTSMRVVSRFLAAAPVTYPVPVDLDGSTGDAYRISSLPTFFLIGRDGVIRYRHTGFSKSLITVYEQEVIELLRQN